MRRSASLHPRGAVEDGDACHYRIVALPVTSLPAPASRVAATDGEGDVLLPSAWREQTTRGAREVSRGALCTTAPSPLFHSPCFVAGKSNAANTRRVRARRTRTFILISLKSSEIFLPLETKGALRCVAIQNKTISNPPPTHTPQPLQAPRRLGCRWPPRRRHCAHGGGACCRELDTIVVVRVAATQPRRRGARDAIVRGCQRRLWRRATVGF